MTNKYRTYAKYSDEEWVNITNHYMLKGMTFSKIKEIYNVSDTDMNNRLKGLKEIIVNVGDKNNRLTIIDINLPSVLSGTQYRRMVRVKCDCGTEFDVKYHDFKRGRVKSCGCLLFKSFGNSFYSKTNTPEGKRTYSSYSAMKARCLNSNNDNYPHYGGRGITICERWSDPNDGYKNFKEDMGERPYGTTLDRIDVNGNYEPSNCRWTTNDVQISNQRRFSHIKQYTDEQWEDIKKDYLDNKLTYDDISEKYSVSSKTIMKRFGSIKKIENKKLWEEINEYYKTHKVTYNKLSEIFGVNPADCTRKLIREDT